MGNLIAREKGKVRKLKYTVLHIFKKGWHNRASRLPKIFFNKII